MKKLTVLAVGAHPDDIEIECAGTLTKYIQEGQLTKFLGCDKSYVVFLGKLSLLA